MLRSVSVRSILGFLTVLALVCSAVVFAQQAPQGQAQGQGRGGRGGGAGAGAAAGGAGARGGGAAAIPISQVMKVEWTRPAATVDQQLAVTQENIVGTDLEMKFYGPAAKKMLTTNGNNPRASFSGECDGPFAITYRHKGHAMDLTGASKIRWEVRTSGYHVVRPVVKLADGTLLVGEHASESTPIVATIEFSLSGMRWIKMDPERAVTVNSEQARGGGVNEVWYRNPDLSKVEEVGFADLIPATGHGVGGLVVVGGIEVYGKPVPR